MAQYAELEISLRRQEAGGYPVELRFTAINSDSEERIPQEGPAAFAKLNIQWTRLLEPEEHGQALGKALFADPRIQTGLEAARTSIKSFDDGVLRIRLFIDPAVEDDLHHLHWELLCDRAGHPIFNGNRILFSRYLSSSNWQPVRGKTDLKALIVIANPPGIEKAFDPEQYDQDAPQEGQPKLEPVRIAAERKRAQKGFDDAGISWQCLATGEPDSLGPATSDMILSQLDRGFDILYLVCHGALMKDSGAILYLEEGRVDASVLVSRIRQSAVQPRLVILASCESAGAQVTTAAGTLSALGPQLIDAGIPAVIAMQGKVKMSTVEIFMPAFLAELATPNGNGQIDRAMGVARERAAAAGCRDYWMPVLFMRLKSGKLWYVPSFQPGPDGFDQMESICRYVRTGECVPVLGPEVAEHIWGSPRKIASALAEQERFPLHSYEQSDIAKVTQFILTQHSPEYTRDLVVDQMFENLAKNGTRSLGRPVRSDEPDLLERVVDRGFADEDDPLRILAGLNAKVFVTASSDSALEMYLRRADKVPVPLLVNWRDEREKANKFYPETTAQKPYVYYVFGKASEKDTWVLTEDDFFDCMMQTTRYDLMPGVVSDALVAGCLLFLGFHLDDWTFRALFRMILAKGGSGLLHNYNHVGVQVDPNEATMANVRKARAYTERYFRSSKIDIFWGTPAEFLHALKSKMDKVPAAAAAPAHKRI